MKLQKLKEILATDSRFKRAREQVHRDIGFQMGNRIEALRLSLGLTQEKFARKVGMQQPAIARMERGIIVPSLPILQKIANALGYTLLLPTLVPRRLVIRPDSGTRVMSAPFSVTSPYFTFKIGNQTITKTKSSQGI